MKRHPTMLDRNLERRIRDVLAADTAELPKAVNTWFEERIERVGLATQLGHLWMRNNWHWTLDEMDWASALFRLEFIRREEILRSIPARAEHYDRVADHAVAALQAGLPRYATAWFEAAVAWMEAALYPDWPADPERADHRGGPLSDHYVRVALGLAQSQSLGGSALVERCLNRAHAYEAARTTHFYRPPVAAATLAFYRLPAAEAAFLRGDYEGCAAHCEALLIAHEQARDAGITIRGVLGTHEVRLDVMVAQALRQALQFTSVGARSIELWEHTLAAFEEAMAYAFRWAALSKLYHLRLYACMARDLFDGRPANPNPFALPDEPAPGLLPPMPPDRMSTDRARSTGQTLA